MIIGNPNERIMRRRIIGSSENVNSALLSKIEPKYFNEARKESSWVKAMNEELDQIERSQTWELVP